MKIKIVPPDEPSFDVEVEAVPRKDDLVAWKKSEVMYCCEVEDVVFTFDLNAQTSLIKVILR